MKNIFILLLIIFTRIFSVTTTFTNAVDTFWNTTGNWSDGVPGVSDSAVVNASTKVRLDVEPSIKSLSIISGSFYQNKKPITVANYLRWSSAGTFSLDSTVILSGDGAFTVGNSGTTPSSGQVVLNGNDSLTIAKTTAFLKLTVAQTGKTVIFSGGAGLFIGSSASATPYPLLTIAGGTFTNNGTLTLRGSLPGSPISYSGVWNGGGLLSLTNGPYANRRMQLPSGNIIGANFNIYPAGNCSDTFELSGNLIITGNLMIVGSNAYSMVFDTKGYDLTVTGNLTTGSSYAGGTYRFIDTAGNTTVGRFKNDSATYNYGNQTFDFGHSFWRYTTWLWGSTAKAGGQIPAFPVSYYLNPVNTILDSAFYDSLINFGEAFDSIKISDSLPVGLTFNSANGFITGTPTITSFPTPYTITTYNAYGAQATICTVTVCATDSCYETPVNEPPYLTPPSILDTAPAAGKRVWQHLTQYAGHDSVRHTIYLPTNYVPGNRYPLIVELPANTCNSASGPVQAYWPIMGYGLSKGLDYIWISTPFLNTAGTEVVTQWWNDGHNFSSEPVSTVTYLKRAMDSTLRAYNIDTNNILLVGFSRGGGGCNWVGLYDDSIAHYWSASIQSSYSDANQFTPPPSGSSRMSRMNNKPCMLTIGSLEPGGTINTTPGMVDAGDAILSSANYQKTRMYLDGYGHQSDWTLSTNGLYAKYARKWMSEVYSRNYVISGYRFRTIDTLKTTGTYQGTFFINLANKPIEFFQRVRKSDGSDIFVTDSAGNPLHREIVNFSKTNRTGFLFVRILAKSPRTIIRVYYGNPIGSITNAQLAWTGSDHFFVGHFEEDSNKVYSSSGLPDSITPSNSNWLYGQSMKIGKGIALNNEGSALCNIGKTYNCDSVEKFTCSFWFKFQDAINNVCIFKRGSSVNNRIWIGVHSDSFYFSIARGPNQVGARSGRFYLPTLYTLGTMAKIDCVFDGYNFQGDVNLRNTARMKIYLNGVSRTLTFDDTISRFTPKVPNDTSWIGFTDYTGKVYLDEFYLRKRAITSSEALDTWKSVDSQNVFHTIGIAETVEPHTPVIDSIRPVAGKASTIFTVRGRNFDSLQGSGQVSLNAVNLGTAKVWTDTCIQDTIPVGTPIGTYTRTVVTNYDLLKDTTRFRVTSPTITVINP